MLFVPPFRFYLFSDPVWVCHDIADTDPWGRPPLPRHPLTTRSPSHTRRMTHTGGALTISSRPQVGRFKGAYASLFPIFL